MEHTLQFLIVVNQSSSIYFSNKIKQTILADKTENLDQYCPNRVTNLGTAESAVERLRSIAASLEGGSDLITRPILNTVLKIPCGNFYLNVYSMIYVYLENEM